MPALPTVQSQPWSTDLAMLFEAMKQGATSIPRLSLTICKGPKQKELQGPSILAARGIAGETLEAPRSSSICDAKMHWGYSSTFKTWNGYTMWAVCPRVKLYDVRAHFKKVFSSSSITQMKLDGLVRCWPMQVLWLNWPRTDPVYHCSTIMWAYILIIVF